MKTSSNTTARPRHGIAALFDDSERKELFKKYLIFLGWIEIFIFASCWLYNIGNDGYDKYGPVEAPFPWRAYFLISFLAPVAITFLMGIVVVGFNKYFGESEAAGDGKDAPGHGDAPFSCEGRGRAQKAIMMMGLLQKLPFLSLLLLLGVGAGIVYNMGGILGFIGTVGEKSVKILLVMGAVLLVVGVIFALVLIIMNYKLRKRSMEYQYRSEVAERFGLIILEDNSVLNGQGKLLVQGKKWKDAVPLLPVHSSESTPEGSNSPEENGAMTRPTDVDFSTP
jgi:membrane protein implicated in regulation of membrane protease activity